MKNKSSLMRMIGLSVAFTFGLLTIRIIYTEDLSYGNYFWNTILAAIPLFLSSLLLRRSRIDIKSAFIFSGWLLFFPNAPYIITDLVHYYPRPGFPKWADILLVTSASWNGLLLGAVSLMKVEKFLLQHFKPKWVNTLIMLSMILCGYGIYLGRFLRYNSWDIVVKPLALMQDSASTLFFPHQHIKTWGFILLFGMMFSIFYYTLKQFNPPKATA